MEKYYEQSKNVNLCAARAYYVPFEKGQAVSYDRADSARFVDLNGIWKIKAYETVLDAENFLMEECEKEIPVPSCVQYHGLDWFQYTNCYYLQRRRIPKSVEMDERTLQNGQRRQSRIGGILGRNAPY